MSSNNDDFETLAPGLPGSTTRKAGPSLKARAIGYLSRREHSRYELARKLAPYTEPLEDVQPLLDELEREGWLSNERFTQSLLNRRAPQQGTRRILNELKQHGIEDDALAELGQQLHETELERARAIWLKKFGQVPISAKDYARQYRFLASRGFSSQALRQLLGSIPYGTD